jgi:hypothetical protein
MITRRLSAKYNRVQARVPEHSNLTNLGETPAGTIFSILQSHVHKAPRCDLSGIRKASEVYEKITNDYLFQVGRPLREEYFRQKGQEDPLLKSRANAGPSARY